MKKIIVFSAFLVLTSMFLFITWDLTNEKVQEHYLVDTQNSGEYAVFGVNSKIDFRVVNSPESFSSFVSDEDGNSVENVLKKSGTELIISAPKGGYAAGQTYVLRLPDGASFTDEKFIDARVIRFSIIREEVSIEKFQDSVRDLRNETAVFSGKNKAELKSDLEIEVGDVLIVRDAKEDIIKSVKVTSLKSLVDKQVITYEIPNEDDIYSELNVYRQIRFKESDIVLYEDEIIRWAEENKLIEYYFPKVGASYNKSDWKLSVEVPKTGSVKIILKYFPASLKDGSKIGLRVEFLVKLNSTVDIRGMKDFSLYVNADTQIKIYIESEDYLLSEEKISLDDYEKFYKGSDKPGLIESSPYKLFSIKIPLTATGSFEFFTDFSIPVKLNGLYILNNTIDYNISNSFAIECKETCKTYTNNESDWKFYPLYALGEINAKVGLKLESGIQILYFNRVGIDAELGIYMDITGALLMEKFVIEDLKGFYEFDMGWYRKLSLVLKRDGLLRDLKLEFIAHEEKDPWMKVSNLNVVRSVNTFEKYYVKDNKLILTKPTVTYYHLIDKKETTKELPMDHLLLYIDNQLLEKVENYYIVNDEHLDQSNKITAVWSYEGKEYKFDIYTKLVRSKMEETLIGSLVSSEIINVNEGIWSYKNGSKYGLVTTQGTVYPARFEYHFHFGPGGICSSRNDEYVCYEDYNFSKEIFGNGWGPDMSQIGLYFDVSKKWLYTINMNWDMDMLVKPYFDDLRRTRTFMVKRVIVGAGSSKDNAVNWNERNEFALMRIEGQSTGENLTLLTGFDFKEFIHINAMFDETNYTGSGRQAYYIVKGKNNLWGVLESTGRLSTEMVYDRILGRSKESNDPNTTFFTAVKDGVYRVIDANNNVFYEGVDGEKLSETNGDTFWKLLNKKWYIVDLGMID